MYFIIFIHSVQSYCPRSLEESSGEVNPINFINQTFYPSLNQEVPESIKGANQNKTIYSLQAFSLTLLHLDLRRVNSYPDNENIPQFNHSNSTTIEQWQINIILNDESVKLPINFLKPLTDKYTTFSFSIFVYKPSELEVKIKILDNLFQLQKYEFMSTTKVRNEQSTRAILETQNIFIIQLASSDQIALPANILPLNDIYQYLDYIVSYSDPENFVQNDYSPYSPQSAYWGTRDTIILPYLPYFSNCQGFGYYIYFYQLTQHQNCTLVPRDATIPIDPFKFGMQSTSDICEDLEFSCILDEKYNNNPRLPRWFELPIETPMFIMQADPLSPELINDDYQVPKEQQIEILTENSIPQNMMPLEVDLVIQYYQVTETQKRIISGSISFNNFYKLSDDQKQNKEAIYYILRFSFLPLNQGELVNSFALDWPVYFMLYIIIGALLVFEVLILLLYHYVMNKKEPRPKIKIWVFLKTFWPQSLFGILLAFMPVMFLYTLITIMMNGKYWTTNLNYASSLTQESESDPGEGIVLFDVFKNNLKYNNVSFQNLRNSRCGLCMIISGAYLAYYISGVYVADTDKQQEIYNGNLKDSRMYKRSRLLYASLIICILMVLLIQFSYTQVFEENAYIFLICNQIAAMIIDYILEVVFNDNLLLSPISIIVGTFIGVSTMGNPTFYEFLSSTFVEKGVELVQRAYVVKAQDFVKDEMEIQYEKFYKLVKRLLDEEDEDREMDDEKVLSSEKKILKTDQEDDSDSEIIFSEEHQEFIASEDESVGSLQQSSNINQQESSFTKNDVDEFEQKFQQLLLEYQNRQYNFNEVLNKSNEEDSENEPDQTDLIDYFTNFANDIITLVYFPFITIIFWIFYDEAQILSTYQIKQTDFIYYILWAVIMIPFQMIMDTLGYNIVEQYHDLDFMSYIDSCATRFRNRRVLWKASEKEQSGKVEEICFRHLDQWCFSSQYYFITTLYVAALQLIILGIQIIYVNEMDVFSDQALIFIAVVWLLICYLAVWVVIFIGKKIKLWRVEARVFPEDGTQGCEMLEEIESNSLLHPQLLLDIPNCQQAIKMREEMERINAISLQKDSKVSGVQGPYQQFQNDQFRKLFVNSNKLWLCENVKQILTPRTLKAHRKQILDQFQVIYGPIDKQHEEDPINGFDNDNGFRNIQKNQATEVTRSSQPKASRLQSFSVSTAAILKYWLYRCRHQKVAIRQVGGLIEKITKPFCEYCGLNWGLGVDTEIRIEDLFLRFLKQRNIKSITKDKGNEIDDWQNFFPKQCRFRTTCFICNNHMLEDLLKDKIEKQKKQKQSQQNKRKKLSLRAVSWTIIILRNFISEQLMSQLQQ